MSFPSRNLFKSPTHFKIFCFTSPLPRRNPPFSLPFSPQRLTNPHQFHAHKLQTPTNSTSRRSFGVFESEDESRGGADLNLDSVLLCSELASLVSSAVLLVFVFVGNFVGSNSKKGIRVLLGGRGLVWGLPLLVATVALNAWIRRRQWSRVCGRTGSGSLKVNLLDRVEKLEADLRSSMNVIRALSRKLEKLGIRFMVTRRNVRDPIAETAALAQRNSEDTRTLAVQEDILEKELHEMQKVLLAMQEQQQKQLELIIAIGDKKKLMKSKQALDQKPTIVERQESAIEESKEVEAYGI